MINILLLNRHFNGATEYARHLQYGLRSIGEEACIVKLASKTESRPRKDHMIGYTYQNVSIDEIIAAGDPIIVATPSRDVGREIYDRLNEAKAIRVVHAIGEQHGEGASDFPSERTVCPRYAVAQAHKGMHIRLPVPVVKKGSRLPDHPIHAVSLTRIAKAKRIDIIAEANRVLPQGQQVQVYGYEDRIYVHYNLLKKFPELKLLGPAHHDLMHSLYDRSTFAVNMSQMHPDDGGDAEYATLHAWAHRCTPVVHREWVLKPGDTPGRVMTAADWKELATVLLGEPFKPKQLIDNEQHVRKLYDSAKIAQQYVDLIKETR